MNINYTDIAAAYCMCNAALIANKRYFNAVEVRLNIKNKEIEFVDDLGEVNHAFNAIELEELTGVSRTKFQKWAICEQLVQSKPWIFNHSDDEVISWDRNTMGLTITLKSGYKYYPKVVSIGNVMQQAEASQDNAFPCRELLAELH